MACTVSSVLQKCVPNFFKESDRQRLTLYLVGGASFCFLVWPKIQQRMEYAMMKDFHKVLTPAQGPKKIELFADLGDNPKTAEGKVVVLELGVGFGPNLKYYPPGVHLIASDIHSLGEEEIKGVSESKGIHFERYLLAGAEDLSALSDESVSAVVTTLVTCSFADPSKAFKEIHRVLVPGGRYYFMEHTAEFEGKWGMKILQCLLFPVNMVIGYCHSRRDQYSDICKYFGKANVHAKKVIMEFPTSNCLILAAGPHVYGKATKV